MNYQAKQSAANKIWCCVLIAVLAILFMQTRGGKLASYNLVIGADAQSIGAQVFLDGELVGTISQNLDSGSEGGIFWTQAANGPHLIEVKKPRYRTFSRRIDLDREAYIGVDLQKATE